MIAYDLTFTNPVENILFDELLLHLAEKEGDGESIRFWESKSPFIVLGRIGKVEEDVKLDQVRKQNIPVLRRSSGGGTVLQGQGCLNFSFVLSKKRASDLDQLHKSYKYILQFVIDALATLQCDVQFMPISDLATSSHLLKVSGNAQKRRRNFILHHGTLLYNFDLKLIDQYLKIPRDVPEYRENRPHLSFITNLSVDSEDFKTALLNQFSDVKKSTEPTLKQKQFLDSFLKEKEVIIKLETTS